MMLPQVMDLVMDLGGNFTVEELKVGQHKTDPSICRMEVYAETAELLDRIVQRARALGATAEHEQPVRVDKVAHEGVFPEGFYSTSNLPTEVLVDSRGGGAGGSGWWVAPPWSTPGRASISRA